MGPLKFVHLPGLNGLRAIAALAVVLHHSTMALYRFGLDPYILGTHYNGAPAGFSLGVYGVSLFFVLSGFLITYLLLLEKERAPIHVTKFYARRILRIWPLYYLYLGIALAVAFGTGVNLVTSSLPFYIFLAANIPFITGHALPLIGHYWSLGVEEQFYLVWPWVVKKTTKHLFVFCCTIIALLFLLKLYARFFTADGHHSLLYQALHVTRFHCLLIGAAGAMLFYSSHALFLKVTTHKYVQVFAWSVIGLMALNQFHIAAVLDQELVSLLALVLIMSQISVSERIVSLERPVFDFLGKISYGVYVVHPLVIYGTAQIIGKTVVDTAASYLLVYSLILGVTIFLAFLSYQLVEKHFLKRKLAYSALESNPSKAQVPSTV
jgi:peptidoglycan/LPS O-acetylase OafA/YrhL